MWRIVSLVSILFGLVGIAAPAVTPMPWRYGVIYWVGEVSVNFKYFAMLATSVLESVFSFWNL